MKKVLHLLTALLLLVSLSGCHHDKELQKMIDQLNEECPIALGIVGQMDNAEYSGNTVTFNYTVLSNLINMDAIRSNMDEFHNYMLENYKTNYDRDFQMLMDAIVKAGADLVVVFKQEDGQSITLNFTAEELAANVPQDDGSPEQALETIVKSARMQLPMTYPNGMTNTDVKLEKDHFVYVYKCGPNHNLDTLSANAEDCRKEIKELIDGHVDASFDQMVELLRLTHRGLMYRYIGADDSTRVVEIALGPDEI